MIDQEMFVTLREGRIREKTFQEKRDALLEWLAFQSRQSPRSPYGVKVKVDPTRDYPVAYCHDTRNGNWEEWNFLVRSLNSLGFIAMPTDTQTITDAGWQHLESRPRVTGVQGFIAMPFIPEMAAVHKAIAKGVEQAGYRPLRIDQDEYLGGIMDQIIARIRESRFVVADLTHSRGGVYYEAGFALGLGIPVVPVCREDQIDGDKATRVHFDVRHLNLIAWRENDLTTLTMNLENRIVASLGRGPLARATG